MSIAYFDLISAEVFLVAPGAAAECPRTARDVPEDICRKSSSKLSGRYCGKPDETDASSLVDVKSLAYLSPLVGEPVSRGDDGFAFACRLSSSQCFCATL